MSFPKFVDSVKRFLTHYLDMSQDREEEAASVEGFYDSYFGIRDIYRFVGTEYQFSRCDYRRYVDFTSDGAHHGYRIGLRYQ